MTISNLKTILDLILQNPKIDWARVEEADNFAEDRESYSVKARYDAG